MKNLEDFKAKAIEITCEHIDFPKDRIRVESLCEEDGEIIALTSFGGDMLRIVFDVEKGEYKGTVLRELFYREGSF